MNKKPSEFVASEKSFTMIEKFADEEHLGTNPGHLQ